MTGLDQLGKFGKKDIFVKFQNKQFTPIIQNKDLPNPIYVNEKPKPAPDLKETKLEHIIQHNAK